MKTLNPSIKHHLIIGALLSFWGFLFAFFARPFEHGEMDLQKWIYVSIGFNLLVFLSYATVSLFQKLLYQRLSTWNVYLEVGIYLVFYLLFTASTYIYYKSPIIQGIYDFPEYFIKLIVNIFLIVTPLIFIARRYSLKLIPVEEEEITLKGENKLDLLKINKSDLVCVSKSQNYVEIYYLENEQLQTKLIRNSLKNIQAEFDFLVQIHRSHLINPSHIKSWKDSTHISLTHIELPVSKNYKKQLLSR